MTENKTVRGYITGVGMTSNHIEIRYQIDMGLGIAQTGQIKVTWEEAAIWENIQKALQQAWTNRARRTSDQEQIHRALMGRVFILDDSAPPPTPPPHDTPPETPAP